ncbi:MAG: GGDEF domain-containing protein [Syntrophotaleaceae bacterium]
MSQEPFSADRMPISNSPMPLPMPREIERLIQQKIEIPSPPRIVVRILEAVRDEDNCFAELGRIISADPALTARILMVANSSLYGCSGKIKTIETALTILGLNALKNIALSFIIVNKLQGQNNELFDFEYFWRRSVTAAVAAQQVSEMLQDNREDIFVSGLLQDIGILVMYLYLADTYCTVQATKQATDAPVALIEKQLTGFNHCELGGALLKQWGLPESIYMPVFYHHSPQNAPEQYRRPAEILNIAGKLSAVYHSSSLTAVRVQEIYGILTEKFSIEGDVVRQTVDALADQSSEVMDFFDIPPGKMKPFSQMLQEANRELGQLGMSYEETVLELHRAREESKKNLEKLIEANKKYREMAYRDELTGLYNRRFFQEAMAKELERIKRYQRGLSLLFFDIDLFKQVNDSYGHLAGDTVLKSIAGRIQKILRSSDVVVRYGGDEFAIIMPETDRKGLQEFAERMRREIESLEVQMDGDSLQVTVSIGAAAFSGGVALAKTSMLEVVDKAIYLAKKAGRNSIHVVEYGDLS